VTPTSHHHITPQKLETVRDAALTGGCSQITAASNSKAVMKRNPHPEVSNRMLAELERGAAPWVKLWSATAGANFGNSAPARL
jgi:hypothetical protein